MSLMSALAMLTAAAAGAPATALELLDCATRMIPADIRMNIRRRYEAEAADEPILEPVSDEVWNRIRAQCLSGADPALSEQLVEGLIARETMQAAEETLSRRHGVEADSLDNAWKQLPPDHRALLSPTDELEQDRDATQILLSLAQTVRPDSGSPQLAAAAADSGDPEYLRLIDDLGYYSFARALLEDRGLMPAQPPEPQIRADNELVAFEFGWPEPANRIATLRLKLERQAAEELAYVSGLAADEAARRRKAGADFHGFEWYSRWEALGETPRLLSIASRQYGQTGGVHGRIEYAGLVWDKITGREIEPSRLFADEGAARSALTTPFCAQLRRLQAAKRGQRAPDLTAASATCGVTLGEQLLMPEDADGDGRFDQWRILVNPYVAGPWAEGTYEVEVPVERAHLALLRPAYRSEFEAW